MVQPWMRTYDVGGGRQLLHDDATVGTSLSVLVVGKPRAEALGGVSCLAIGHLPTQACSPYSSTCARMLSCRVGRAYGHRSCT
jgi:hypothetical protein